MKEIWKLVDNKFYVSNLGNIKDLSENLVDLSNRKSRYIVYKKYFIHRLVAEIFIPNPENKREVNHKDGNKHNNSVNNLEWVTTSENRIHAYKSGLQTPTYGFKGHQRTQHEKELISAHNARYWKGKKRDPKTIQKMSEKLKGRTRTEEQKKHQSEAIKLWWKKRKEGDTHSRI